MFILNKQRFNEDLRQLLQQPDRLPSMPETARALIGLRNNPEANINQLVDLLEMDPALAAFVIHYARMSVFGYGNRITSVHQSVLLVLGFNTALNLSMSIAASGCLQMPNQGVLGRVAIWNETLECAALCRELHQLAGTRHLLDGDITYLCGLFHNFGYMLFAHLFPNEFSYLNDCVTRYPEQNIRELQLQIFGITHNTIGMHLVKAWNLPDEIAVAVAEQRFPDYAGKHALYVKLIALAKRLLSEQLITDDCPYLDTEMLENQLGIEANAAASVLERVLECRQEFHRLAQRLAA